MNMLKQKVIALVKEQIADAKRGVEAGKAKREISFLHVLGRNVGAFHGLEIHVDNLVVQAFTAAYGDIEPNAILADGKIIINEAFNTLDAKHQEAIYFHELAHLQKEHRPNPILYPIQTRMGFGYGIQMEYEADEFSALKGADMLGALQFLYDEHPAYRNRATSLRIKRLKVIGNVR